MGGPATSFALGALLPKRASLIGTVLRSRPIEQKIEANQRFVAELLPLFDEGTLKPVIDSRYRLEDIADAHLYMESNANFGKIILSID